MSEFAAIPTLYNGTQFRSRLEARWAAYFDLLDIEWQYEPIDLPGYIPDFQLKNPFPVFAEVKPAYRVDDFREAFEKVKRIPHEAWPDHKHLLIMLYLGVSPENVFYKIGNDWWPLNKSSFRFCQHRGAWLPSDTVCWGNDMLCQGGHIPLNPSWREAGNKVQWMAPR